MKMHLTKKFCFSASHNSGSRVIGHNYILSITAEGIDENLDVLIEQKVKEAVVSKLDSRDLGVDVEFLKGAPITDAHLMKSLWTVIQTAIQPVPLCALTLEKDRATLLSLSRET